MNTNKPRQRLLPFDQPHTDAKEQARRERCQRLLAGLGQPPEKLTTGAKMFDYAEATKIARGQQ
jgi:hypothetical protein